MDLLHSINGSPSLKIQHQCVSRQKSFPEPQLVHIAQLSMAPWWARKGSNPDRRAVMDPFVQPCHASARMVGSAPSGFVTKKGATRSCLNMGVFKMGVPFKIFKLAHL